MAINPQGQGQGTRNRPEDAGANFNRLADEARNKAQETVQAAGHKAQELGQTAGHKVQEAGTNIRHRAEETLGTVGQQMSNLGDTLREKAPREGMLGNAASRVADTMQTGGRYLQEHDLEELSREVSSLVRNYPFASIGVCFGLGCLLGMTWNRR